MQRQRQNGKPYIRKIDFVFYNESEIRDLIFDERNRVSVPELRNGSGISDPTARDAINNLSPIPSVTIAGQELKWPERWIVVVDKTYNWAKLNNKLKLKVAKMKYKGENFRKINAICHISTAYQYLLLENFRKYAAYVAKELGLLKIEEFEEIFS